MNKNILVVTGSPRKGGNSDILADSFITQVQERGFSVQKYEAAFHNILPCKACNACWSKDHPCFFNDDFNVFSTMLEAADVIVFVTPLYWYGFSAQIKLAIDKFYAYEVPQCPKPLKIKESAFIVCGSNPSEQGYQGIIQSYKDICAFTGWKNRGVLVVPGVTEKGDVRKKNYLEKVKKLCDNFKSSTEEVE
ncbi:flavodoxin family protein [Vallitalea pronyensis]|uniref:Flavodoxin family protein n=1 Tax=Vallitalea pronyensis TaxID=1348613 RepID=A0A8J8SI46_9FIRM|nr:flavodoxin family protein [Vallitalea pronyensis]QUI24118.1 flavodoxin family protein [Vallitalea pronyensis]